jgi:putative membrane protein
MNKKGVKNFFYRMLCGAFLGISVIAPGISGSIMAVMMGIYDELITIISNPFKNFKKNVVYLIPMVIGAGAAVVLLIQGLDFLFEHYTVPAYLLFMSLIAGSIPTVIAQAKEGTVKKKYFVGVLCALAFALAIGVLAKTDYVVAVDTTNTATTAMKIYLPICGGIAGMMSMVPGMSVSMLLMMFSVYEPLLHMATSILSFSDWFTSEWFATVITVCTVVLAFLVGMILFSNITKRVFEKYRSLAFLMVLGFMTGSVISIFPGLPSGLLNWMLSIIAVSIGLGISFLFKVLGKKFNVKD